MEIDAFEIPATYGVGRIQDHDSPVIAPNSREISDMGFVNEFASEDDIKKYQLKELWDKYHPFRGPSEGFRYDWTVDRENAVYCIRIATGHEEFGNRVTFILSIRGKRYEIKLDAVGEGGAGDLSARPFRKVWAFVRVESGFQGDNERAAVLETLKEALSVYGFAGALRQIPDTIISFQF
jgi:hypothetical protein